MELPNIPQAEPLPDARARFDQMLEFESSVPQLSAKGSGEEASFWRSHLLQGAVAAALVLIGVAMGYYIRPSAVPSKELADLRNELYQTRQMVALSLMQQQAATDRLKGISWSYQLQQPSAELLRALLDRLMHDPSVNVRLATVDALRQFGDQPAVRSGVVEAMAQPQSPMVEISLIDLAVDLRQKESIAALRQFAQDQKLDQAVRERAEKGLVELE
jgi:uncharacterized protein with HEPN domain